MTPSTTWRRQGDIDILMMGDVPVGRIHAAARSWIFNLNYPACFWKGEKSEAAAREALFAAFNAWLLRAGIADREDASRRQGTLFEGEAA